MTETSEVPETSETLETPIPPDLPNGWSWWSGNRSKSYYTQWFGTNYRRGGDLVGVDGSIGGFDGQVYWDKGGNGKHHVEIIPITGVDNDDPVHGYPTISRSFDSEKEAVEGVVGLIAELKQKGAE